MSQEHAQGHTAEAGSIRERLARILDRGVGHREVEVARETGPGHEQDEIRARLGRILGREAEQAEPEAGGSAPGPEAQSIRERLQAVLTRDSQVEHDKPERVHGHERDESVHRHKDRDPEHELE